VVLDASVLADERPLPDRSGGSPRGTEERPAWTPARSVARVAVVSVDATGVETSSTGQVAEGFREIEPVLPFIRPTMERLGYTIED
jgi:hypothetical protein